MICWNCVGVIPSEDPNDSSELGWVICSGVGRVANDDIAVAVVAGSEIPALPSPSIAITVGTVAVLPLALDLPLELPPDTAVSKER